MRSSSLLLLSAGSIALARVAPSPSPASAPTPAVITPAPSMEEIELRRRQLGLGDLGSLAPILMTALPPSILAMALTNVPAVSRLLWSQFLDDNTPAWFTALPTDVQQYLSGEFGPTSTAITTDASSTGSSATTDTSVPAASETALNNETNSSDNKGGLPLWAKSVIGIAVPLFVIALIGLLVFCCLRRRRRRRGGRGSRAPTPAFISSSNRPLHTDHRPGQEPAMRGGHYSNSDNYTSSSSEAYQTPVGGPSYEDLPPVSGVGMQQRARGSRQSFSSLHSVPEVTEPMPNRYNAGSNIPMPPPRSSRRSQDFTSTNPLVNAQRRRSNSLGNLNTAYNVNNNNDHRDPVPTLPYNPGQGIYAGGQNPYPSPYTAYSPHNHNPFNDPSPPRQSHMPLSGAGGAYRGSSGTEEIHPAYARHSPDDYEQEWPLKSPRNSDGYAGGGASGDPRSQQWEYRYSKDPVYEMH